MVQMLGIGSPVELISFSAPVDVVADAVHTFAIELINRRPMLGFSEISLEILYRFQRNVGHCWIRHEPDGRIHIQLYAKVAPAEAVQ